MLPVAAAVAAGALFVPEARQSAVYAARSARLLPNAAATRKWQEKTSHLPQQPCPAEAIVVVGIGQSNAANALSSHQNADPLAPAFVYFNRKCYSIGDPVPGTDRNGGSIWPPFAHALADNAGKPVIIIAAAASGSSVLDWASRAAGYGERLERILGEAQAVGLAPDLFIWIQGETDAASISRGARWRAAGSGAQYGAALSGLFDRLLTVAPDAAFLVTQTSKCHLTPEGSPEIRVAQQQVVEVRADTFAGGDTDRFGDDFRHDGCHFNAAGAKAVSAMLAENALIALDQ
jgi:hypothetical protein